jgi:hypothetical protein
MSRESDLNGQDSFGRHLTIFIARTSRRVPDPAAGHLQKPNKGPRGVFRESGIPVRAAAQGNARTSERHAGYHVLPTQLDACATRPVNARAGGAISPCQPIEENSP